MSLHDTLASTAIHEASIFGAFGGCVEVSHANHPWVVSIVAELLVCGTSMSLECTCAQRGSWQKKQ